MYLIFSFVIGLSKSRPKLGFGSSVCLHFQPLKGNKLLRRSVEAPQAPWHSASLAQAFLLGPAEVAEAEQQAPQPLQDEFLCC